MKKMIFVILIAILLVGCTNSGAPPAKKKLTIAVIPKGTTHEFWKSIHAGSNKAAQELTAQGNEIEVIWKGPLREDDREQQIQVVEGFAAQGVSGIVLAPLDNRALVRPVADAQRAGVPTVIIDSGLESEEIVSFVATDNRKGRIACRRAHGPTFERQGQGIGFAICRRFREHDRTRTRFSGHNQEVS